MLTGNEYIVVWVVYLAAASGLLLVWWKMTSVLGKGLFPRLLRVIMSAILLTPWTVAEGRSEWAPALFVGVFDATLIDGGSMRALEPLGLVISVAVLLATVGYILEKRFFSASATDTGGGLIVG